MNTRMILVLFLVKSLLYFPHFIICSRKQNLSQQGFFQSLLSGLCLIFISELLDRTFFLNMIYGLNHSFFRTFIISSVTLLSLNFAALFLGKTMPFFFYRQILDWIAVFVFFFFGVFMVYDGVKSESHTMYEDFVEVKDSIRKQSTDKKVLEVPLLPQETDDQQEEIPIFESTWPFVTSLVLAECGDKSQITGVVIGAVYNFYGVLIGTSIGLLICIFVSIWAGKFLSKKINHKQMHILAGSIFLLFGVSYLMQVLNLV
jgi:putative Ca2+/H+ antiporter (TMEM165/GDT1 family)